MSLQGLSHVGLRRKPDQSTNTMNENLPNTNVPPTPTTPHPQIPLFPPNQISIFTCNANSLYKRSLMSDCISSIPTLTSPVLKKLKANDISLISDTRLRKQELSILRNRLKSTHHLIGSTVPEGSNKRSETLIALQKF